MANPLNRNLKKGDKLVMDNGAVVTVDCLMFGCSPHTSGTAIGVLYQGRSVRADSYDIDPDRTMAEFAEANGWTTEKVPEPA